MPVLQSIVSKVYAMDWLIRQRQMFLTHAVVGKDSMQSFEKVYLHLQRNKEVKKQQVLMTKYTWSDIQQVWVY